MKSRIWMAGVAVCLALGSAGLVNAASYYVDDGDNTGDIWTPDATGNAFNRGTTPTNPALSLNGLIASTNLQPGDIVYIDTGTYGSGAVIPTNVLGTALNPIVFQGSTNGTTISGSGVNLKVQGSYLQLTDIRALGGAEGVQLDGAKYNLFSRVTVLSNSLYGFNLAGVSSSNLFKNCSAFGDGASFRTAGATPRDNSILNCTFRSGSIVMSIAAQCVTNIRQSCLSGAQAFLGQTGIPLAGSHNMFWVGRLSPDIESLDSLHAVNSNWTANTYADPLFLNQAGADFHLKSPAGFVSNGVWVVDPSVPYSPAIDFGARGSSVGSELDPNGGRVNVGVYGGTAEASKSQTNDWLFAMTFNDGGTLWQTGRLEWAASTNFGALETVDLQFTTNNWATTNVIDTVMATNESYVWAPAVSYPAVLWRVVSSADPAVASTNAKPFSIRTATNTAFTFYVNDGSAANDVYGMGLGDNANDGAAPSRPKRSLQAILDAYQLRGGDAVYVDTGDYATNFTTTITSFDSGSAGNPVRIIGSPNGSLFNRGGSPSAYVLDISGASHLEMEHLRLTGGHSGLYGSGSVNVWMRNLRFTGNRYGVTLAGAASRHVFEGCLSADNTEQAFNADSTTARSNQWLNGTMWNSPTILRAQTNALSVSNSILGNGTYLFGSQIVPGNHNLVWNTGVDATYGTFSAFQNAALWQGWERSLYADPLFANSTNGDFHVRSLMGRYDTNTQFFATNDAVHSPAIDFGNPLASVSNEPPPNGSRLNAGMFGGTAQASKSRTNAWLQTLSYMDGGTLDAAAGSWLRWDGGEFATTSTVTLWLSRDRGFSWEILATNEMATNGAYWYQNTATNDSSALFAQWRVTLDPDTDVLSQIPTNFAYKNGPYEFFVNDASTNGDVYCSAGGSDTNEGLSAAAPMATLQAVINTYKLGPGDRVYVDTGSYVDTNAVEFTSQDSGVATNPVVVYGSTNLLAGGSVFGKSGLVPGDRGFVFLGSGAVGASNIVLKDVVLTNWQRGVVVSNAANIRLEGVEVRGGRTRAFELLANARNVALTRCVAHGGGVGVYLQNVTNAAVGHCVFWQNTTNAVYVDTSVWGAMSNSILASTNLNAALYSFASLAGFSADYNGLHAGSLARVGVNRSSGAVADNVAAWIRLSGGKDVHSIPGDPQLANPVEFDYHLMTEQTLGRLLPNGQRTSDLISSPLLDAGNPASDASGEPVPNGGRVNVGRWGGTEEASIAWSTPWIRTASFGDQGFVTNGEAFLVWTAGGGFTNETATLEVSVDGGNTWEDPPVATNVPVTNGIALWTVAGLPDTPGGAWRVTCEQNTNAWARSTNFFSIRATNGPLHVFVNGADTNDTVYAKAPGSPANWSASSNAPLDSVRTAFDRFDLEPGDRIWVDPGTYPESAPILIGMKNSGTTGDPVRVTGHVGDPYTGTVLSRTSRAGGAIGVQISRAGGVAFDSLTVSNAHIVLHAENSQRVVLDRVRVGYSVTNAIYVGAGARLEMTGSIVEQSLASGLQTFTGAVVKVANSLIRDNAHADVVLRGGDVEIKNSVLEASGNRRNVYYWNGGGTLAADYNNIRVSDGASVAGYTNGLTDRFLIDWQTSSGFTRDMRSFGYDAKFADPSALDFHLKSQYGRYAGGGWINDAETSRLIDLGDPAFSYANEPTNNGGRINVGLYGNTTEASKSSGTGVLVPLTMSDGGTIRGEAVLYWAWNGFVGNEYVDLHFSADGGSTWTNIATNVYINVGSSTGVVWNTTDYPSTAQGVWEVMLAADTNVYGRTETLFAIKNAALAYYVNDASTNQDVYCTAIGRSTNTGLSVDAPLNSVATLLALYKIEHGDTIYVDTGTYPRSSPLTISIPAVAPTNFLVIQGSTNEAAGGTVFTNSGSGAVFDLQDTRNVELRDVRLHGGSPGLLLTGSSSNQIVRVRSVGSRGNAFELGLRSDQNRFIRCAALNFYRTGFHVASPPSVQIASTTNYWANGVMAPVPATSNGTAVATGVLVGVQSGRLYLSNSVFVANSPAHDIYSIVPGAISGDYNAFHRPYPVSMFAQVALSSVFGLDTMSMDDLARWSAWNQSDSNSLAGDPLFADLAGGDLHLRSQGGRYLPVTDSFESDAETSPLIDAADPSMAYDQESDHNGHRANVGIYGNTPHASRTPTTNGSFVLLTFNQGGMATGTNVIRWIPRGQVTNVNHRIDIQLSTNSGASYDTTLGVSTGSLGSFTWNSTANPTLPTARLRLRSQSELSWSVVSERDFAIHNTNIYYYVNDASTNDDMYTSAAGSLENTGLRPDSPLPSLAAVLARHDLEPGDVVLVDAGTYAGGSPTVVGYLDSGTAAEPVVIQGCANHPGTTYGAASIRFDNARGVLLKNIRFQSPSRIGAEVVSSEDIVLEEMDMAGGTGDGVAISASSNILLRNFSVAWAATNGVVCEGSFNTRLEFGTLWSNGAAQVSIRDQLSVGGAVLARTNSSVSVSNCVLGSFGIRIPIYVIRGTLYANHNNLYLGPGSGALAALSYDAGFGREFDSVGAWANSDYGQDSMSLSHDPLFANAGAGDFHLKSTTGRWASATASWTNDAVSSSLIDAGDPLLACSEPLPNGGRVNLGRHGNTAQASWTPTNSALTLVSFNDGGRASGTNVLVQWNARGDITSGTVSIYYSSDGGQNWTLLVAGISAADGSWIWDSTLSAQSVEGKLKIEGSDGSEAISDRVFSVRNAPFYFYVNDSSTNNDVYCSASGQGANSGLTPDKPMSDFNALLAKYDLEGGDVVYIDTGVYQQGADPWRIAQADSGGSLTNPVVFQGSTNSLMNGTVLDRRYNNVGIRADYAVGIRLRNIVVSNTVGTAVVFNDCYDAAAEWVAVGGANLGFELSSGSQLRIDHCVVVDANQGIAVRNWNQSTNTVFPEIEHSVIWGTDGYAIQIGGQVEATVQHNVLSVSAGQYLYGLADTAVLRADYNSIWLGDSGRVFRREQSRSVSPVPIIYDTVGAWAAAERQDLHSYSGEPLMVDSTNRNFHLRSRAGRWDPVSKSWIDDAVSSPLIDMGSPDSAAWANEPTNNGARVNVGLYGGTVWASRSETNSALHLLTLNRGGVASGQVALNWMASGATTGRTVRIEVSVDDGGTWNLVADGLAASMGGIDWSSSSFGSSPLARWRVLDEVETGVVAASELPFVLHNGPIRYYVNDEGSPSDVYCLAEGNSANDGLSPGTPKRWISEIVDTYDLEPGDLIYVDTGVYQTAEPTRFGDLDAGGISQVATQQVNVVGSTNRVDGGSLFILSDPTANGFHLDNTYGIRFSHLGMMGASNGLFIDGSYYVAGEWLDIQGCGNGIKVQAVSSNMVFTHSALADNEGAGIYFSVPGSGFMDIGACVFWSNRFGLYMDQGYASVSNSIFGIVKPDSFGLYVRSDNPLTGIEGDYNCLYVPQSFNSAVAGLQTGAGTTARTSVYASVSAWTLAMGQDAHSLAHDPEMIDPGNGDFHLKSPGGRYEPGSGWVYVDTESSALIDAGTPQSLGWTMEPDPHGRRVNIGRYGGSAEASKTPMAGWLTLLTLNDGGTAEGLVELRWAVGGAATNHTVCIEYSPDDGVTWSNIVCGWPASTGSYMWDSVPYGRSALGRWRIFSEQVPEIVAYSLSRFILRNGGQIFYYVNDSSTNGDVYCSAIGHPANDGLTADKPQASLQAIIDAYELAPEDFVFVDAGTYVAGSPPVKIDQTDSGWSNLYVTVQGSTNPTAPTVFSAPSFTVPTVFSLEYAVNVRLKDMTIRNAQIGVSATKTIGCEFDSVRIESHRVAGLRLNDSESNRLVRSVLWKNADGASGNAVVINQGSIAIENSVLWGSPTAVAINQGTLTVTNSVLNALGTDGRIYRYSIAASPIDGFRGDYNNYARRNGALICEKQNQVAGPDLYNDLPGWSVATSSDRHSMTLDPAFANEIFGDFHPQSKQGRYSNGVWTNDPPQFTNSPLIDAGSLAWPYDNEPEPSGDIVNVGAYGNTAQASLSQTNPPWLRVVSYNDEGIMSGNVWLYWLHGGMPSDARVQLDYSTDYMISWKNIASNVLASEREYEWDVSAMPLSLGLNWRVVYLSDTNAWDASDVPVVIKTGTYDYYVNDASTNGDVYCANVGLAWDDNQSYGTNAATPLNSLATVFAKYPVGAGDRIFVDTGDYSLTAGNPIVIDAGNMGTADNPVKIYGSTNFIWGGTRLLGGGTGNGITILNTRYIELYDFRVAQAHNGISIQNAADITMAGMELFNSLSNGLSLSGAQGVELRNSRLWGNGRFGYFSSGSKGEERLLNATIWGNRRGAVSTSMGLVVSNSILCVTNAAPIYVEDGPLASVSGDYNLFGTVSGSILCSNRYEQVDYSNLRQWQEKERDLRSFLADPLFVDPAAGDFHLQSQAGFWSNGSFSAVSANTSWAIDAGPAAAYSNEPLPNGDRINLGAYGGTGQASLSDMDHPGLLPTTLGDGGVAPFGQPLYWLYRGINPTNWVQIDYSPDGGITWSNVVNGIQAGSAPHEWFGATNSTPEALWRVVLSSDTNVFGETSVLFMYRPQSLIYYVNDADTNRTGDIYTTAIGSSTNRGYLPHSPLDAIQTVLAKYQLLGGDEIRVDTGVYAMSNSVIINVLSSGDTTNRVTFTGSTNWAADGSWMQAAPGSTNPAFLVYGARDVNVSNFRLTGFLSGVEVAEDSARCTLSGLDIQGSIEAGVLMDKSQDVLLDRVLIREGLSNGVYAAQSKFVMESCVLWSNRLSAVSMDTGVQILTTNSILDAMGVGNYCYQSPTNTTIQADYNDLLIRNGAQIASINGLQYEKLPQWVRGTSQDRHSLSTDPWFHDPANGDFHLRSVEGRCQYGTGWTNDVATTNAPDFSPLIDMGAPQAAWSNEPVPHGGRRNIGLYGGTTQASLSNTNGWLQAITAMSGGILYGGVNLVWGYGGTVSSNAAARLEYSYNNGLDWVPITPTNITVGLGEYYWQSDRLQNGNEIYWTSPGARWRIVLYPDTNMWDMTDTYFGLRNRPFKYYVNDASTNHDVFATAGGDDANMGFYPAAPMASLITLLREVDLEATDEVYVDTGTYHILDTNSPILWEASDGGSNGQPVRVFGSTHADRSTFIATNPFVPGYFFRMEASYIDMQNLHFAGESIEFQGNGLVVSNLTLTNRANLPASMALRGDNSTFDNVQLDRGSLSLSGQDTQIRRLRQRWGATSISGTNIVVLNSVVYTTNNGQVAIVANAASSVISNCTVVAKYGTAIGKLGSGTLRLGHNILVAGGSETNSVIAWGDGGLLSDWNNLLARNSAWVGIRNGKWEKLAYWQIASGQDANSVSFEPRFAWEEQGDFHLSSVVGRWNSNFSNWEADGEHSPMIDLGDPSIGTGSEIMPNGYRPNLGAYGRTDQASKSRANMWATALTANDGGVLKGSSVELRWAGPHSGFTNTYRLEYSADGGATWDVVATGQGTSQGMGSYVWDTTGFPDSFDAMWRVVSEDGSWADTNDVAFALRNHPADFFVNDDSTDGDVYCDSAIGSSANSGLSNSAPKLSLQQILDAYDLEGEDVVYVDTGTYSTNADIRIIWSRSGSTNGDVVIQGNTNDPYATRMERTGAAPTVGIDVKASRIQLRDMNVRGIDRGIALESNQNATVQGVVFSDSATGLDVRGAQGTVVRNSGFWKTGIGVNLQNTSLSVLENLTFAGSLVAGIQLQDTVLDTLQNNVFIPGADAYAYSIGESVSLLEQATMDYNLYDFSSLNSGFYAGATNFYSGPTNDPLRRWQLGMNRDYRSAITNADLADAEFTGDFHPRSPYGRWTPGGWWIDATNSWAVDHGNPDSDYGLEPTNHGERINIGMYGNTAQASKGSTNVSLEARTLNGPGIRVTQNDQIWPMIWSAHLLDCSELVNVQYSGGETNADGSLKWINLATNLSACEEYFVWQATIDFSTAQGLWRVVSATDSNLVDQCNNQFIVQYRDLWITRAPYRVSGLVRFDWEGGIQGLRYEIRYSDDFGKTWKLWEEKYNGPAPINKSNFVIPVGGSQLTYTFEDRTSYLRRTRWYTIIPIEE